MPIDLIGAVVAWLVATSGDAGIHLIRGRRDERKLRGFVGVALDAVVEEVEEPWRSPLRNALALCFSGPPSLEPDGSSGVENWLRAAIATQLDRLDDMINQDTGKPFFHDAPVSRDWLTKQVGDAIIDTLRQVVASRSLAELVHGVDTDAVLGKLDALGIQIRELAGPAVHGTASLAAPREDWVNAVMAFADMEDPEFRRTVLRRMGKSLGLDGAFLNSYRPVARDHVDEIISRCEDSDDPKAAFSALADTLTSLRPHQRAANNIQRMLEGL